MINCIWVKLFMFYHLLVNKQAYNSTTDILVIYNHKPISTIFLDQAEHAESNHASFTRVLGDTPRVLPIKVGPNRS